VELLSEDLSGWGARGRAARGDEGWKKGHFHGRSTQQQQEYMGKTKHEPEINLSPSKAVGSN